MEIYLWMIIFIGITIIEPLIFLKPLLVFGTVATMNAMFNFGHPEYAFYAYILSVLISLIFRVKGDIALSSFNSLVKLGSKYGIGKKKND